MKINLYNSSIFDPTLIDIDFFECLSEKTNYLINDDSKLVKCA